MCSQHVVQKDYCFLYHHHATPPRTTILETFRWFSHGRLSKSQLKPVASSVLSCRVVTGRHVFGNRQADRQNDSGDTTGLDSATRVRSRVTMQFYFFSSWEGGGTTLSQDTTTTPSIYLVVGITQVDGGGQGQAKAKGKRTIGSHHSWVHVFLYSSPIK